jgi:ABC-2 family transporter protein
MIRLAAIQSRVQMMVAAAGLAAVAALLLVTGPHLADLYRTQIENCAANHDCAAAQTTFLRTDRSLFTILGFLSLFVPAALGVFLGAPLVARELETGTFRLAWTQSVSRTRWLAVKIAVAGLTGMAVAGLVSLFVTWWAHPLDRVQMAQYTYFDQRSVVPVAYAAFAIALGVACGILLRRTVPAMAATLAGFVAVRLGFTYDVRAHLLPPSHLNTSLSSGNGLGFEITPPHGIVFVANNPTIPNAMVLSSHITDASAHTVSAQTLHAFVASRCPAIANPTHSASLGPANQGAFNHCIQRLSSTFHLAVTYQPPSRYWPLQWSEFGIFLGAALVLVGVAFWRIRRAHG